MSTYYHLLCNDCKEKTDAASRSGGGWGHLVDSEETLPPFIIAHSGHNTEIITEHSPKAGDGSFVEWTIDNVSELIDLAKERGDWI